MGINATVSSENSNAWNQVFVACDLHKVHENPINYRIRLGRGGKRDRIVSSSKLFLDSYKIFRNIKKGN